MLSTQQILQAAIDLQGNAQRALPVLPNNGNPRGAFNMPRNTGGMQQPQQTGGYDSSGINPQANNPRVPMSQESQLAERFPWLKPSASMDNVRNYLNGRRGLFQQPSAPPQEQPVIEEPVVQQRAVNWPVLPARR